VSAPESSTRASRNHSFLVALIRSVRFMLIPLAPDQVHARGFMRKHRAKTRGENPRGIAGVIWGGWNLRRNKKTIARVVDSPSCRVALPGPGEGRCTFERL
jgi:hypothetical protein